MQQGTSVQLSGVLVPATSTRLDKVDKPSPLAFKKLPSTGTWLMNLPATRMPVPIQPISAQQKMSSSEFRKLPSTGTWLIARLSTTGADEVKQAKAETGPYNKLPSVGTWLAPLMPKKKDIVVPTSSPAPEEQVFQLRPSVGTW